MKKISEAFSEIGQVTPENLFNSRRKFLKLAAAFGTAYALAACGINPTEQTTPTPAPTVPPLTDLRTPFEKFTSFPNYYEFSMDKNKATALAQNLKTSPWPIEISGLVKRPATIDAAELIKTYTSEERVYRMRCVEAWSMVVPWMGFPLHRLLADLEVKEKAQFIRFTTLYDPEQMEGQKFSYFTWPYVEGLRLDEARHDLTLLAWGAYGKELTPQNGAPLRLVVPWKYGFKSIKSIVKIELVEEQPESFWQKSAPNEYGFYANVNPNVDHPRWSQGSEYRVGETGVRPTLMFNGYEKEVAALYEGMDLAENY
ncbi:MAG TPA: protein-methionine-sulfoxide reductase catalytic subunit MsrP [Anaerolineaceae bacterium]|nr:protein-methionine-sulfoxide reductase catalytic subunit MsrP [Anaerolineaceae bacterium]